ncbi:hypothetical protein [Leuconostoc mesenteroides]|uniref:hypothetical protein n=1 Tax=Leuconostoc mesenteroides TaxID=1245 RepID=UPI00236075EF|nr:hypothetical protein [Leuconostoc mesenteroides]
MENRDFDSFSAMVNNYFQNDYRERGKVKWQGFFLSDHTAALKRENRKHEQVTQRLPRMSLDKIMHVLIRANANYLYVTVQQDIQDAQGNLLMNSTGMISSINDLGFFIDNDYYEYETIRAVKIEN